MINLENLKKLPNGEVSFQDDFYGGGRDLTLTPKYIIDKIGANNIHIGDQILLWEKDTNAKDEYYYLCNIGKVTEITDNIIKEYLNEDVSKYNFVTVDNKPVFIKIDGEYFDLPLANSVLIEN